MFSYYHSFFLSHERKETEKMHFSVLFAIQESFKFPFFCALSHVISSCTWHSLQHVWQFHFQTGSTSKRKELLTLFENNQKVSLPSKASKASKASEASYNYYFMSDLTITILMQKLGTKITSFCINTNETFLGISKHCVRLYSPFHWNWNGCWCFHKPENASRRFWGWEK